MSDKLFENGKRILEKAKTILLVDWASPDVPFALIKAGFTVFSYATNGYSMAGIDIEERPASGTDRKEKLVFRQLYKKKPFSVDIVNVFRPAAEHAAIINDHVLPLNAQVLWLQPTIGSSKTRNLAFAHSFAFVEGIDIAEVAKALSSH